MYETVTHGAVASASGPVPCTVGSTARIQPGISSAVLIWMPSSAMRSLPAQPSGALGSISSAPNAQTNVIMVGSAIATTGTRSWPASRPARSSRFEPSQRARPAAPTVHSQRRPDRRRIAASV